ncbi:DnaJ like protein subfamily C member 21 [Lucilia cuprina]|nr:DnaJ like protein subfamily C member 21 [Lucilia cuprina]
MKCYYEELGVERDADESQIKTAYRKLALRWHPDKNPDCMEEAKERFQLIQQAYEVLSDSQERTWYDNHREQILRGKNSDYEDNCLDVFQYFTVSCFKGYADDAKGFYSVYREVFEKIAAEDAEFMDDDEELQHIPTFGNSASSYEEVVGPFYAYWSAYCTKRTYTWLCPYDIKEIKDRRILREIEKDMKKIVQKAKKERNEEVRNLVSFIRKRDKRVQAYKKLLEERAAFNRQKQEQNRLEQIRRRKQELEDMKQNSQKANESNDDYEEQLKQLEMQYSSDDEYYEDEAEDENEGMSEEDLVEQDEIKDIEYIDELYCVACNKEFKTGKAFANHETSKKHRDNIEKLKIEMQDEEHSYKTDENCQEFVESADEISKEENEEDIEQEIGAKYKPMKSKVKKDAKKSKRANLLISVEDIHYEENIEEVVEKLNICSSYDKEDDDWSTTNKKSSKKLKNKNKTNQKKYNLLESEFVKQSNDNESFSKMTSNSNNGLESETTKHECVTCKSKFDSKNKLFSHLKLTNHGVYIPKTKITNDENIKARKGKGKKN